MIKHARPQRRSVVAIVLHESYISMYYPDGSNRIRAIELDQYARLSRKLDKAWKAGICRKGGGNQYWLPDDGDRRAGQELEANIALTILGYRAVMRELGYPMSFSAIRNPGEYND